MIDIVFLVFMGIVIGSAVGVMLFELYEKLFNNKNKQ